MAADDVELRGMMPRKVIDVLDAVSGARRMARNELALEVLQAWANEQVHIARIVQRVAGHQSATNGIEADSRYVKKIDSR